MELQSIIFTNTIFCLLYHILPQKQKVSTYIKKPIGTLQKWGKIWYIRAKNGIRYYLLYVIYNLMKRLVAQAVSIILRRFSDLTLYTIFCLIYHILPRKWKVFTYLNIPIGTLQKWGKIWYMWAKNGISEFT